MKKESINAYTRRLTEASRAEVIVILYDIILEDIRDAKQKLEAEDRKGFVESLAHSLTFVKELIASLDMRYPVSKNLASLYIYANGCINRARITYRIEELEGVLVVMEGLRGSFEEVARNDNSGVIMTNTQKIYAGLTYGRHSLNETMISADEAHRGVFA